DSPVLNTDNWGLFKAGAGASFEPVPYLTLKGDANVQNRSDGQSGHHFNVGAKFEAFGILVEPGLSTGSIMPTPQQLYWQSNDYSGDTELQNEQIQETHLKLSYDLFPGLTLGGHLQQKKITNPIMVQDRSFSNIEDYTSQAASIFVLVWRCVAICNRKKSRAPLWCNTADFPILMFTLHRRLRLLLNGIAPILIYGDRPIFSNISTTVL